MRACPEIRLDATPSVGWSPRPFRCGGSLVVNALGTNAEDARAYGSLNRYVRATSVTLWRASRERRGDRRICRLAQLSQVVLFGRGNPTGGWVRILISEVRPYDFH